MIYEISKFEQAYNIIEKENFELTKNISEFTKQIDNLNAELESYSNMKDKKIKKPINKKKSVWSFLKRKFSFKKNKK